MPWSLGVCKRMLPSFPRLKLKSCLRQWKDKPVKRVNLHSSPIAAHHLLPHPLDFLGPSPSPSSNHIHSGLKACAWVTRYNTLPQSVLLQHLVLADLLTLYLLVYCLPHLTSMSPPWRQGYGCPDHSISSTYNSTWNLVGDWQIPTEKMNGWMNDFSTAPWS